MDIRSEHQTAVLSVEELAILRNPAASHVIGLGEIRKMLPGLLTMAQSRLEVVEMDSGHSPTDVRPEEVETAQAEVDLVVGMMSDLMFYDMMGELG